MRSTPLGPKAFKSYYNISDPAMIQQRADAEVPLEQIIEQWPVGTDPRIHINRIQALFDSGVSIVNIHTGQSDQRRAIEFYGHEVLPKLRLPV